MASVEEENNVLQIWQMASNIYQEDEGEDEQKGGETMMIEK